MSDYRIDRVQASVTVWRAGLGYRVVTLDYVPAYGDPLADALLERAQELNRVVAEAGPATFGGIS